MKTFVLFLFMTSASAALADDNLLQNGDFSDGISKWEGDCHSPDSASVDLTAKPASGVVVKLRPGDWTKISQDFEGQPGDYVLTVTYTVSPDASFSRKTDDYFNVPGKLGIARRRDFISDLGQWVILIDSLGARHLTHWKVTPSLEAGVQTITQSIHLNPGDTGTKGFFLGFPPGDGEINLQSITLVPKT